MKTLWPFAAALLLSISGCSKAAPEASAPVAAKAPAEASMRSETQSEITGDAPESVRKAIAQRLKEAQLPAHIASINSSGMANVYWVTFNDVQPLYISGDGQYILQGELIKLDKNKVSVVSEGLNAVEAKKLIGTIPEKDMIIFSPQGKPKAVVYAFTDVNCGYCRKLHSEMEQINAKGIEVRYLAWPRGPSDLAVNKAVWCSEDRKAAMTTAKHGLPVQAATCNDPVIAQRQIGMRIGVAGTPALYDVDGRYLAGYLPADELAKKLGAK
jgi:thiol:disulfide interchange protein DsbC